MSKVPWGSVLGSNTEDVSGTDSWTVAFILQVHELLPAVGSHASDVWITAGAQTAQQDGFAWAFDPGASVRLCPYSRFSAADRAMIGLRPLCARV